MHPDEDKNLNHTRGDIIDFYSLKKKVVHSEIHATNFAWVDGADEALFTAARCAPSAGWVDGADAGLFFFLTGLADGAGAGVVFFGSSALRVI